ncbi:hypothetical protein D3C87_1179760 [compost metagenome]
MLTVCELNESLSELECLQAQIQGTTGGARSNSKYFGHGQFHIGNLGRQTHHVVEAAECSVCKSAVFLKNSGQRF